MEQILRKRHDYLCKEILSYKFVLATIMKYTLKKFEEYSIEEIIHFIGNNDNEKVIGIQNAFPSHEYDVLFTTKFPKSKNEFDMLIDMEPQKVTKLGYQIHNRGIFYIGNEITYQFDRFFNHSEYDKIKPVVSIFIGLDAPNEEQENSLTCFHLTKDTKIGYNEVSQDEYDKIRIIIIYLGKTTSEHPLFKFLNFIFKSDIKLEERVKKIKEEYGIQLSGNFKEAVIEMCNISDYFKQQGIEQGIDTATIKNIQDLMKNLKLPLNQILNTFEMSEENKSKYKKIILSSLEKA